MAWLGTWTKRREITVSNTNIDSDLTHFAVPIFINSTAGTGTTDLTSIFDELDDSSLKIAVTKSDGTTQIYVDVEQWDGTGTETAVIWVAKSDLDITASSATTLYIYYDSAQSDNTTWVSTSGGTAAQSVWDSNYKAVYHLSEASGIRLDSTSNNNDLTDNNTVLGATGQIDGGADFEQDNTEYLSRSDANLSAGFPGKSSGGYTGDITISAIIKHETLSDGAIIMGKWGAGIASWRLLASAANGLYVSMSDDGTNTANVTEDTGSLTSASTFYHVAAVLDVSTQNAILYVNGAVSASTQTGSSGSPLALTTAELDVGAQAAGGAPWDGIIDEARLSTGFRTAAWVKADYNAGIDNLVSYGSEENIPGAGFAHSFGIIMG